MISLTRLLAANRIYFFSYFLFLCVALFFGGLYAKSVCFLHLNFFHCSSLDWFFIIFTYFGDGWLVLALFAGLLIWKRFMQAIHVIIAYLTSGIAAQLIKQFLPAPRPKVYFSPDTYSKFIDGITGGGWSSFPSGHTATAFAVATILALHTRNKNFKILYLLLAIGVGYSRIYLGQHFLEDVCGGAIIGVLFAICTAGFINRVKIFNWQIDHEPATPAMVVQQ